MASPGRTGAGETGFFYEKTQVAIRRFGKKPGFFGMCASRTDGLKPKSRKTFSSNGHEFIVLDA
jgi:hypothetical protein